MATADEAKLQAIREHAQRIRRYRAGEITADEFRPIRLSYGLYYQLDHTSHMQRVKVTGGLLTAPQLDALAEIADRWARGVMHVTTRQDVQFHWVPLDAVEEMYEILHHVGISTRGACSDSVRNVTASPCSGTCSHEAFDVLPYALTLAEYFLFHPLNITLPRKFKPAFSGCSDDEAQGVINDLAFYAQVRDGREGFAVLVAGGLGPAPHLARRIRDFLPVEDTLAYAEAVVRIQHRYGERKNRHKARMKFLLQRMGAERFGETVEAEYAKVLAERGEELRRELREGVASYRLAPPARPAGGGLGAHEDPSYGRWLRTNTVAQRQPGYRAVTVNLPLGDVTSDQLRALTALARRFGNATMRATNDQSLVIPFVAEGDLAIVYGELERVRLAEANALHLSDVTSCPGADYCSLAVTRSMSVAERIRTHFAARAEDVERLGRFRVKISGCPNACGQHHIGDIGLTGMMVKDEHGVERPHCAILLGGSVGEDSGMLGRRLSGKFREEDVPYVIDALTSFYRERRLGGEGFRAFVERVGVDRVQALAESAPGTRAYGEAQAEVA